MSWITPKTDWNPAIDRFNAEDFNRIKNNLSFLRNFAVVLYADFDIQNIGDDKTPSDYFYADEINALEGNFSTINSKTLKRPYGTAPEYIANGPTMDFAELNRLESAMLDIFNKLNNQSAGRRTFTWNFGMNGGL